MAVFLSMTNYASQMTNNVSRDGVTVMRHKVCHFDTPQFNYLESIATHDDKNQRHNLCQFFDKTTQPVSIFENVFSISSSIAIYNNNLNFTFLS